MARGGDSSAGADGPELPVAAQVEGVECLAHTPEVLVHAGLDDLIGLSDAKGGR